MAKAVYFQKGESLDYVNPNDTAIEAGDIVVLATRIGVAGTSILPGELGSLHVVGVFEVPKTVSTEIVQGAAVYFDGNGITTESADNTPAGFAAYTATDADTTVHVKIG